MITLLNNILAYIQKRLFTNDTNRLRIRRFGFVLIALFLFMEGVNFLTDILPPPLHIVDENTLPLELIWTYETKDEIRVPPLANNHTVIILHTNGKVIALDNQTGNQKWEYDTQTEVGWPWSTSIYDLNEELVVISENNDHLVILDVDDGKEISEIKLNITARAVPNILIVEDVVVISTPSIEPGMQGYIAGYSLKTGELFWEKWYLSRVYDFTFRCSYFSGIPDSDEYTVCVSIYNQLEILNFNPQLSTDSRYEGIKPWLQTSSNIPNYQEGFIFSNPPPKPSNQVFYIDQNESFYLYKSCSEDHVSHPVETYEKLVLASTGCNDLYLLDIGFLREYPEWVFQSQHRLMSSFVTLHGDIGYSLNDKAEIIGIDLKDGQVIGSFTTTPARLEGGIYSHSLTSSPPYLYAFLNGNQLFAFKEK